MVQDATGRGREAGPGVKNPTAPLDKTRPLMAEWRAHDESFMFARERGIRQIAAQRELTPERFVSTMRASKRMPAVSHTIASQSRHPRVVVRVVRHHPSASPSFPTVPRSFSGTRYPSRDPLSAPGEFPRRARRPPRLTSGHEEHALC